MTVYPINKLQDAIILHQSEIDRLNNIDPEMACEMAFIDDDIKQHKSCILELQKAIKILYEYL